MVSSPIRSRIPRISLPLAGLFLGILGGILASCSQDPNLLKKRYEEEGVRALSQGKVNEAIIDFENLVKLSPHSAKAYDLLAKAYRKKGWIADAVTQEEQAVQVDPRFVPGLLFLSQYGYRSGQLPISLSQARQVLSIDPGNVPARVLEIRMTLFLPVKDNHEKARKALEALLASHSHSVPVLLALGDLDLVDRRLAPARGRYQEALALSPLSPDPWVGLGNCALLDGKIPEARNDFKKAWALSDRSISTSIILANFEVQQGHVKKAIALLTRLSKRHGDGRLLMKLGEYHLLLGQTAQARRDLEPLSQVHLDLPELHADLAMADLQDHKEQAAYNELSDVLNKVPGNVRVRTVMAQILMDQGHPEKGLDLLRPLRSASSLPPETWILWARLYEVKKKLHSAEKMVIRGIDQNPGSRLLKIEHMRITATRKAWKDGLEESDSFLKEFPLDRTGILEKVFFLEKLHQSDRALKLLQKAQDKNPADPVLEIASLRISSSEKSGEEIRKSAESFLSSHPKDIPVRLWLANFDAQGGHPTQAQSLWVAVRAIDPTNVTATVALARAALRDNSPDKAKTILGPSLSAHPDVGILHVLSGEALERKHQSEKAAEEFAAALRIVPGDVESRWKLATLDHALGRMDEARLHLSVLRKTPGLAPSFRAQVLELSGFIDLQNGDLGSAQKDFLKAATLDPKNPSYLVSLGRVESSLGKGREALQSYTKALALDPKSARLRIMRDRLALGLQTKPSRVLIRSLQQETQTYLSRHPGSILARQILFESALSSKDWGKSRIELDDLERLSPDTPGTLEYKARLALINNQVKEAQRLFRQVVEKDPTNLEVLKNLSDLAAFQKDWKDEEKWLSRLVSENPEDLHGALVLASLQIMQKEFPEAESVLTATLAQHPHAPEAQLLLAQAELGTGKTESARTLLASLVKRFPSNGSLYLLKAESEERLKTTKEAIADYRMAIRLSPKNPVGYNNLAFLLAQQGKDFDEALHLVRQSRRIADSPVVMDTEGLILSRMGRYREAENLFSQALAGHDEDPDLLLHMANNEVHLGDFSTALHHGREALHSPGLSGMHRLKVEEAIRVMEEKEKEARKDTLVIRP